MTAIGIFVIFRSSLSQRGWALKSFPVKNRSGRKVFRSIKESHFILSIKHKPLITGLTLTALTTNLLLY